MTNGGQGKPTSVGPIFFLLHVHSWRESRPDHIFGQSFILHKVNWRFFYAWQATNQHFDELQRRHSDPKPQVPLLPLIDHGLPQEV